MTGKVWYGHQVADPCEAPELGPDRSNRLAPEDLDAFLAGLEPDAKVTFDDGYRDNLSTAVPLLERHGRPATVFVTTGFVTRTHAPIERVLARVVQSGGPSAAMRVRWGIADSLAAPDRYAVLKARMKGMGTGARDQVVAELGAEAGIDFASLAEDFLSWEEVARLDTHPLITVGAHTVSHPSLRRCTRTEIVQELVQSRDQLESVLGRRVPVLAYPYGAHDHRVRRLARKAGYRWAYATEPGLLGRWLGRTAPMAEPRYDLNRAARGASAYR